MNSTVLQHFQPITEVPADVTEIDLATHEVWSRQVRPGSQIACQQGIVWITQSNDPHDYILHPGQRYLATCEGKVVAQAIGTASS